MGVMSAKASASKYRVSNEVQLGGSNAIRVPRASPSNIWWKMMTIKSEVNAALSVTTTVTPMTNVVVANVSSNTHQNAGGGGRGERGEG